MPCSYQALQLRESSVVLQRDLSEPRSEKQRKDKAPEVSDKSFDRAVGATHIPMFGKALQDNLGPQGLTHST